MNWNTGKLCAPTVSCTSTPVVLTAAQSGSLVVCNYANALGITLPTALAGLRYKFVIGATQVSHVVTITGNSNIGGCALNLSNTGVIPVMNISGGLKNTCLFGNACVTSDMAIFECDGTNWNVIATSGCAQASGTNGISFA